MFRIFIYLFPAMFDLILSGTIFVGTIRIAEMAHASASEVAAFPMAWSLVYVIAPPLVGRIVTRRNTGWLCIGACVAVTAICLGFTVSPSPGAMYLLMGLLGVAFAFFFPPFQVFMKHVDEGKGKGLAYTSGLYVFSWSTGFALGPFVSGYLWEYTNTLWPADGWRACFVLYALASLGAGAGMVFLRRYADEHPPAAAETPARPAPDPAALDYGGMPDLAWMAWVCGGLGVVSVMLLRAIFPVSGVAYGLSKPAQGWVLGLLSATQALVGLALHRSRTWMYRPRALAAFALCGILGLGLFAAGENVLLFGLGAVAMGIYCGSFFFYFVFHSLAHPEKGGRNVSINEAVVGFTGILGPLMGGLLADGYSPSVSYLGAAGLIAVAMALQFLFHGRHTDAVADLEARHPATPRGS